MFAKGISSTTIMNSKEVLLNVYKKQYYCILGYETISPSSLSVFGKSLLPSLALPMKAAVLPKHWK
jgi:hypothetical protein